MVHLPQGAAAGALLLGFFLVTGCGSQESPSPAPSAAEQTSASPKEAGKPDLTPPANSQARRSRPEPNPYPVVEIVTSLGTITLKLNGEKAPGTVRNFLDYVGGNYYDGTIVHYVDPSGMVLLGGFKEHPETEAAPTRAPIRNEAHNGLQNKRGTVAMSREFERIDSATCQFFINVQENPSLDHRDDTAEGYGYCVFGEVIGGMEIVDRIAQSPANDDHQPQTPIVIQSIREVIKK